MTVNEIKLESDKISKELFNDDVSKQWLKSCLQTSVCTVTFTKKNGDDRVMKCTLDEQYFPVVQKEATEVAPVRQKSNEALSVYDVDAQGWRSFRYDSIKRFEMTI